MSNEIINQNYKHSDITGKVIGCAMKVHVALGNGFQEVVYQRCLAIEMTEAGIEFAREEERILYYKGYEVGTRRADFIINDSVMVELKSAPELTDAHLSQALNYLQAYKLETGLLINFGSRSLQYKRVTNERRLARESQQSAPSK